MEMQPKCSYCNIMGVTPHCHNCSVVNRAELYRQTREIPMKLSEIIDYMADKEKIESGEIKVGDYFYMPLMGEKVKVTLVGYNHDELSDKSGKAHATFATCFEDFRVNFDKNNYFVGGWAKSRIRNIYMKRIFDAMPAALRKNIKTVRKENWVAEDGSWKPADSREKCFLFSEIELTNKNSTSRPFRLNDTQYDFFERTNAGGYFVSDSFWLRTMRSSSMPSLLKKDNGLSYDYPDRWHPLIFGFCL